VYFDDGTLLGIASLTDGSGVDFEVGASPGELPGANGADPDFATTAGFSADSEPAAAPNGVAYNEYLVVTFNLINGKTYDDVIAALDDGSLRIGMHVQALGTSSDSFVNDDPFDSQEQVPEPSTLALTLVGLVSACGLRRRRVIP
jgi:hypothetical protein